MTHEIKIPSVGESIVSATIATWHKSDGQYVKSGEVILTIDTDKISTELEANHSGILHHMAAAGDEVAIGAVVARIEESEAPVVKSSDLKSSPPTTEKEERKEVYQSDSSPAEGSTMALKATPAAKKAASSEGVDLARVRGTGPGGKITKADVFSAATSTSDDSVDREDAEEESAPVAEASALTVAGSVETSLALSSSSAKKTTRRKMSALRRKIATHLVNAQQEAAILTTFNECDMSSVINLRKRLQDDFVARNGVKLGFMSFFIKAVVDALKAVPSVNAQIEGDEIVENHFYDIGVAVGTERGLFVPVVRDCDQKSFAQIERDITDYAKKARDGKIALSDLQGGVFTVTNGGTYGSLLSTPIINPPQAGILGMHSIQQRPVVIDGKIEIRPMMYLALSYDHRLVDGKEAVTFLVRVKQCIESPERMLLEA